MKSYWELIDEVSEHLHERVTSDDDEVEEAIEEYAIDHGIYHPESEGWAAEREGEGLVRFETRVTQSAMLALATRLLADVAQIEKELAETEPQVTPLLSWRA